MRPLVIQLLCASFAQCLASEQAPLHSTSSSKHLVLTDDLIAFHKNLTQIESITYNEEAVGNWLAESLESQGYNVEKQHVDKDAGRFNLYAFPGETRDTKVLVSSHIDTVRVPVIVNLKNRAERYGRYRHSIHTGTKTKRYMVVEVSMTRLAWPRRSWL